ncbi:MAG: type IV secretory system conjugative DNA transfer family protein [Oscillospiraceae bacterium]|nr:type IV secretory system conjugative DNA transfer family protein [Oscillospiraceae bacterium]
MNEKTRRVAIVVAVILGCAALLYLGGLLGQLFTNYNTWLSAGGMTGKAQMQSPDWNPLICITSAFTGNGLKALLLIVGVGAAIFIYIKVHDKFSGISYDERGFTKSKHGTYGTADWMTEKEMKSVLEVSTPEKATGMILGERKGQLICLPEDTRLNRHTAVFGASGTMKSRAVVRNALFSAIRRGESVLISDPKSEMYNETSELFRKNGYEVKVLNLVDPLHSDSWNCMSDLGDDTLMAQMLTNVIIGNTSSGKGDHFWDNGEANLLKGLVLCVQLDPTIQQKDKNLTKVYEILTGNNLMGTINGVLAKTEYHAAKASFSLFAQSSETVRQGIILGLGTRLQVLQDQAVKQLVSRSDIDLTAPGKRKCAYYIILSDQETSMAFISSLFFSFLFIKLTRFADNSPGGKCLVPVNMILDEFNNIGRIGGAPDGSDFCRSLSVIRSRDIRVMIAVQSLGQLQNRYPNNLWAEIVGNCDIQLMLGCTDDVTAEYISERSGEMSIQVDSTMTVKKTVALAQVIPQYRETQGQGRRKLLTADEVLRLPHEEMLVIIRGQNMLKLKKFDYTRHPLSKELVPTTIQSYIPSRQYSVLQTEFVKPVTPEEPRKKKFEKLSPTQVVQNTNK